MHGMVLGIYNPRTFAAPFDDLQVPIKAPTATPNRTRIGLRLRLSLCLWQVMQL